MLDNVLNSVRRGMERARVRGEEAYQATRLRLEIFNLNREQDTLFGRLGRAYHGGSDVAGLAQIQSEIRRVAEEIRSRELLIDELGHTPEIEPEVVPRTAMTTPLVQTNTPMNNPANGSADSVSGPVNLQSETPAVAAPPQASTPQLLFQATPSPARPEGIIMTSESATGTDTPDTSKPITERPKAPNMVTPDPAERILIPSEDALYKGRSNPDAPLTPDRRESSEDLQREEVHKSTLREGELATEHPDPLEK